MKRIKTASLCILVLTAVLLSPQIAASQSGEAFKTLIFTRSAGADPVTTAMFDVTGSYTAPFTMTLRNGDGSAISTAVTSATVTVNNVEVVSQRDLSKQVHEIDDLALKTTSGKISVKVTIAGEPGSYMTLIFSGVKVAPVVAPAPVMPTFSK